MDLWIFRKCCWIMRKWIWLFYVCTSQLYIIFYSRLHLESPYHIISVWLTLYIDNPLLPIPWQFQIKTSCHVIVIRCNNNNNRIILSCGVENKYIAIRIILLFNNIMGIVCVQQLFIISSLKYMIQLCHILTTVKEEVVWRCQCNDFKYEAHNTLDNMSVLCFTYLHFFYGSVAFV